MNQIVDDVWSEAKASAIGRHNEGLETALDIALNDRRLLRNSSARQAVKDLYNAEKRLPRITPKAPPRSPNSGSMRRAGKFLPPQWR